MNPDNLVVNHNHLVLTYILTTQSARVEYKTTMFPPGKTDNFQSSLLYNISLLKNPNNAHRWPTLLSRDPTATDPVFLVLL